MVADACEVGVRGQGGEVEWRSMVHHFFMRCVASAGAIRCLRRQRALESRQPSRTVVVDRIDRNSAQCARAWSQVHFSPPSNTLSQRQTMDLSRPSFYGSFRAWISVGNPSKPATIQLNASSSDGWTFMRQRFVLASLTVSFLATAANAQVPLTWDSTGHVVVPALVNGKGPYDFILDTGADESAVYAWFAKSLDLPKGESRELSGATGSEQMTVTRLSTLGVDGHVVGDIDADTVPDRSDGAKIAGIVGVDLMAHKLAVIDFACKTFALRPVEDVGADIVGKNAKLIKAGSIGGGNQLTLPVTVNGVAGTAVLDTGSRSTQINSTFAAAVGISPNSDAFKDIATRGATETSISARVGPIGTVHFAGITRANAVARVVDLPYLKEAGLEGVPAMNLGLDLLRGTRLTVDYSARRFWLAPSSCLSEVR